MMEGKVPSVHNAGQTNHLNLFVVCVDATENGELSGRLFHCFSQDPFPFIGVTRLLIDMDSIFDYLQFPQASTQIRTFRQTKSQHIETRLPEENCEGMDQERLISQRGIKGTFLVRVQFRQNTTWQGTLVYGDLKITQQFRSALELLKLIDGALNESQQAG